MDSSANPIATPIPQATEFVSTNEFPSSIDDVVHLNLAKLMRDLGAPRKGYDEVMKWAANSTAMGYNFAGHYGR